MFARYYSESIRINKKYKCCFSKLLATSIFKGIMLTKGNLNIEVHSHYGRIDLHWFCSFWGFAMKYNDLGVFTCML